MANLLERPASHRHPLLAGIQGYRSLIDAIGRRYGIEPRDLELQALLHVPRLAERFSDISPSDIRTELIRLVTRLDLLRQGTDEIARTPFMPPRSPRAMGVSECSSGFVDLVCERYHYLLSHRDSVSNFGLKSSLEQRVSSLVVFSRLDQRNIIGALANTVSAENALMLSRSYSFQWAPPNSMSFLIGSAVDHLRRHRRAALLVTYVNPNLGFTGSAYRAANWTVLAHEHGTHYSYIDNFYVTDRQLITQFGTADPALLRKQLGARFLQNRMRLNPLDVYAFALPTAVQTRLRQNSPLEIESG